MTEELTEKCTQDDLRAAMPSADQSDGGKARIKFDSLPTALRAIVSDASDIGITIEAELPWLTVGTALRADCANGVEYTARVQSFDLDIATSGAARLRIFAALVAPEQPQAPPVPSTQPAPAASTQAAPAPGSPQSPLAKLRLRRLLAFGAFFATSALLCHGVS